MSQRIRSVILHNGGIASGTLIAMANKMYETDEFAVLVYRDLNDKRIEAAIQLTEFYELPHVIQRSPLRVLRKHSRDLNMLIEAADIAIQQFPALTSIVMGSHIKAEVHPNFARKELWQNVLSDLHNNKITLQTPFLDKNESYIVDKAIEYELPLNLARDCTADTESFCGECHSCRIRINAFRQRGYMDYDYEKLIDFGLPPSQMKEFESYLAGE